MLNRRLSPFWLAVVALLIATLACGPLGGDEPEPTEAPTEEATEAPTEAPTEEATEAPTEAPTEADDSKSDGGDDGKSDPGLGNTGSAGGINTDNVANLDVLFSGDISESAVLAVAASPFSHEFATFGFDKIIRIWDAETGDLIDELPPHAAEGFGLQFSPDGTYLASGGGFEVKLWDTGTGDLLTETIVNARVFRLVWAPDNTAIAVVGDGSSRIDVIDPSNGQLTTTINSPDGVVLWAIAFSPDERYLATSNANGVVRVFELESGDVVLEDSTPKGAGWDLEFSANSGLLASCNGGGGVYIWDTASWDIVLSGDDIHPGGCTDGDFSAGSDIYFSVGHDGVLNGWSTNDGSQLRELSADRAIWALDLTGDGAYLGLATDDGSMFVLGIP